MVRRGRRRLRRYPPPVQIIATRSHGGRGAMTSSSIRYEIKQLTPTDAPLLKDLLRDTGKDSRMSLTPDQIQAFEEATLRR